MTEQQIVAELARIEKEMLAAAAKSRAATQEAMRIIEQMMADLGVPMSKERADAQT